MLSIEASLLYTGETETIYRLFVVDIFALSMITLMVLIGQVMYFDTKKVTDKWRLKKAWWDCSDGIWSEFWLVP